MIGSGHGQGSHAQNHGKKDFLTGEGAALGKRVELGARQKLEMMVGKDKIPLLSPPTSSKEAQSFFF